MAQKQPGNLPVFGQCLRTGAFTVESSPDVCDAATQNPQPAQEAPMQDDLNHASQTSEQEAAAPAQQVTVNGRSVFAVETTAAGVAVSTVFLTTPADETQTPQLLAMPAVFPDLGYALQQIDRLRETVVAHFSHAARLGAQLVAAQHAAASKPPATPPAQAVAVEAVQEAVAA